MNDRRLPLIILAGVLLLAAIGLLGIRPRLQDAGDLDRRIDAQTTRAAALRSSLVELRRDRDALPANRRALHRLAVALPPTARAAALLRELDALARRHGVRLAATEVTTGATTATLPPGAQPSALRPPGIPMRITLDGRYPAVRRFLAALDRQVRARGSKLSVHGRLLTVDGVSTAQAKDGHGLETTLVATAHVAPDPPGVTAATAADARRATRSSGDPFAGGTAAPQAAATGAPASRTARTTAATPKGSVVRAATTALGRAATSTAASATTAPQRYVTDTVDLRASRVGHVAHARRDVARLSLLPSAARPVAMYAGVLKDRRTVALLVGAGATVRGGTCKPSRTSCSMLLLRAGKRARIADPHSGVVAIRVVAVHRRSTTDARAARAAQRRESPAGRCLLTTMGVDGAATVVQKALRWGAGGCAR